MQIMNEQKMREAMDQIEAQIAGNRMSAPLVFTKMRELVHVALDEHQAPPFKPTGDSKIDSILKDRDPAFDAVVASLPENYWGRYDLSAMRIGWHFGKRASASQQASVPDGCRERLVKEGKPYPKSSCSVCGPLMPRWKECDALLSIAATPQPRPKPKPSDCEHPYPLVRHTRDGRRLEFCTHCGHIEESTSALLPPKDLAERARWHQKQAAECYRVIGNGP